MIQRTQEHQTSDHLYKEFTCSISQIDLNMKIFNVCNEFSGVSYTCECLFVHFSTTLLCDRLPGPIFNYSQRQEKESEREKRVRGNEWNEVRLHFLSVTCYLTSPRCYGCQNEWVSNESGSLHTPKAQQKSWLDFTATLCSFLSSPTVTQNTETKTYSSTHQRPAADDKSFCANNVKVEKNIFFLTLTIFR